MVFFLAIFPLILYIQTLPNRLSEQAHIPQKRADTILLLLFLCRQNADMKRTVVQAKIIPTSTA